MVNDIIGGVVTSKFLKKLCKIFLFSSKNIRQHFFVKYVKTKHCFGPNGRKNHKIYHRDSVVRDIILIDSKLFSKKDTLALRPFKGEHTKVFLYLIDFRQRRVIFKLHSNISYLSSLISRVRDFKMFSFVVF